MHYKTVLSDANSRKDQTTFRRVYYHPVTGYQIAVVTKFHNLDRYWVSFPSETPNAFTFRVGSIEIAERLIKRECSLMGKWVNRMNITIANARIKLPKYYE